MCVSSILIGLSAISSVALNSYILKFAFQVFKPDKLNGFDTQTLAEALMDQQQDILPQTPRPTKMRKFVTCYVPFGRFRFFVHVRLCKC